LFAALVLSTSAISFPLLLDRDVGAAVAMHTSLRVMAANPVPMALWGLIVAALLAIGSIPFFVGLAVVLPMLGHATWHLYRRTVEPDPHSHADYQPLAYDRPRRSAADFLQRCSRPIGGVNRTSEKTDNRRRMTPRLLRSPQTTQASYLKGKTRVDGTKQRGPVCRAGGTLQFPAQGSDK
jgi:hypothetical protein